MKIGMGEIHQGHVLDVLRGLPENSVDCVVTSPPYWGLRDYKIEPQVWDAVDGCEHQWGEKIPLRAKSSWDTFDDYRTDGTIRGGEGKMYSGKEGNQGSFCQLCGAWRGSLGLEPTPELFVSHIVQVFREVRRVLKPTGVCFVNLGDSYNSNPAGLHPGGFQGKQIEKNNGYDEAEIRHLKGAREPGIGKSKVASLKPKDLCGIPWRCAFALQADGWWLRSDIIWAKSNPMPESVTDRPTKSHEYIFLLTKSAKYFWNQEAVREAYECAKPESVSFRASGKSDSRKKHAIYCPACDGSGDETDEYGDNCHVCGGSGLANLGVKTAVKNEGFWKPTGGGRDIRSVWTAKPDLWRLRSDISASDRAYVLGELLKRGSLGNTLDNESDHYE